MPFRLCRHIKTNGLQCQSPAMRGQPFCYFHDSFRRRGRPAPPVVDGAASGGDVFAPSFDGGGFFSIDALPHNAGTCITNTPIDLGLLEDAEAVQVAISAVVNALAGNRMQAKRGASLLYGLQLAAMNCRNLPDRDLQDNDRTLRQAMEREGELIAEPGLLNTQVRTYDENDHEPPAESTQTVSNEYFAYKP